MYVCGFTATVLWGASSMICSKPRRVFEYFSSEIFSKHFFSPGGASIQ